MAEEQQQNYGLLIEEELNPLDWRAGGVSAVEKSVLRENGDYTDILPQLEYQIGTYFDTMACVTFSALNNLEILARFFGVTFNKSDRFTAKMSGTTKGGNYLSIVADSVRMNHGAVDEERWPYPRTQRQPVFDWDDFYAAIPENIQAEGLEFLKEWKIRWEWVPVTKLREYLKYGPIQVTVQAWPKPNAQGIYENRDSRWNHAVTLVKATDEYYEIYDHYEKSLKKLAPDYKFGSALQFTLTKNVPSPMPNITLPNNVLVQDVEDSGAFGMHLDGKIMTGNAAEVLATVVMRSPRKVVDGQATIVMKAPVPLKKGDWDSFPKVNMKNEPID